MAYSRRARITLALTALALTSTPARGGAGDGPAVLPNVLVTGSHLPQTETPVAQSVVVIPPREIRDRAPASFLDLLRAQSTLHVDQAGAPGGFSALYLRGADPSHTAILIDGVKVTDPTNVRGGGIDLSLIDPRTVERVEILPGASSAVYGADAMAGVLNIITREARHTGATVSAGFGGDGYRRGLASGSVRAGALGLHAQAAALDDGRDGDDARTRVRTGSIRLTAGERGVQHASAFVRAQTQKSAAFPEDSGGPLLAVRRALETRETEGIVAGLDGERRFAWGGLRLYSNVFDQDADIASPGVAPGPRDPFGLPRTTSYSKYRRWAVGASAAFGTGPDVPLLVGAEYEHERGEVSSTLFFGPFGMPANFNLERHTRSAYAETRLRVHERVSAQAGVRVDDTERHGTRTTYRAGLRYRVADTAPSFAVNFGTGFKPPSFFALGHPLVGNPQLRPEESRTIELNVSSPEAPRGLRYRAALFRSQYENLVDFDPGPPPRLVNRSEVKITGYEVALGAPVTERLDLRGTVTGLTFDLPEGVPALRSRPKLRASAVASYAFSNALGLAVTGSFVGRTFDSSIPTGATYLGSYLNVDAALTYAFRTARVVLAVDNVLDRDYQQFIGFPARGRRARVELALEI